MLFVNKFNMETTLYTKCSIYLRHSTGILCTGWDKKVSLVIIATTLSIVNQLS